MRFKAQTDIHVDKKKPFSLEIVNCEAIKIQEFKRLSFAYLPSCNIVNFTQIIVQIIVNCNINPIAKVVFYMYAYTYYLTLFLLLQQANAFLSDLQNKEKCKYYNNTYLFYEK